MKTPTIVPVLLFSLLASVMSAVPPGSPNSSSIGRSTPGGSASGSRANGAKAAVDAVERRPRKIEEFLVRAEITVDDKGKPTDVKLLNPTDDKVINQKLADEIRRRRFAQPKDSTEPTAGTFTVTVRVQVES